MAQTLKIAGPAVLAATVAGLVCGALIGLAMGVGASIANVQQTGWMGILSAPVTGGFTGFLGAIAGSVIGFVAGSTISAAWAIIQRYFRLGFASDLCFVALALMLYALREAQLDRMAREQLGIVVAIMMLGSVIAAVVFRRLLGLPLAFAFREPATD